MSDRLAMLREPFPANAIGKLPRVTCKACVDRQCSKHEKQRCDQCQNYISTAHIHLDYVGHAAVTDRLLQVDPEWTWEPVAYDADGLPLVRDGELWIRLTVCGVTRLGVGGGPNNKVRIGNAIRNAAMRFGVALDLWAKEDLHASVYEPRPAPAPPEEVARVRALAEQAGIGQWVADQGFPWPWPPAVCAAIEAKANEVAAAVPASDGGGEPASGVNEGAADMSEGTAAAHIRPRRAS